MLKKISVFLILILVFSCSFKFSKAKKKKNENHKERIYTVKKGTIQVKLEETGTIEPLKIIQIKSIISGRIIKEFFEEGDYIQKGDTIAYIEPDFNQAREIFNIKHNLELKKIELDNKQKDFNYKKKMFEKNYISEQDWINVKTALRQAEINYQLAKQQFDLVKNINFKEKYSPIISDVSGAVLEKSVEEGETVTSSTSSFNSGTVIYKLADLTKLIIKLHINEIDIAKIWKNQKAKIQVDAFPYKTFNGKISSIGIMAKQYGNVQAFPVRVEIDDNNGELKPGMTANITIFGKRKDDILVIPIRTVFSDDEGNDIVYKVENDTLKVETQIKTGINDLENVEIISGLEEGDKISYSKGEKKEETPKKRFRTRG